MTRRESSRETVVERPRIHLRILGPLDVCDEQGRSVDAVLAQPRRLALLAFLTVASRNGFVRRDQALAMFWPERDAEHARAALNRAIYYLRQALGDDAVVSRGLDELAVPADQLWCDAVAVQSALVAARYDDAVGLYRGELLEGFFASGAAGFERWVEDERRRLASDVSRAAWSLADDAERVGHHAVAARWCQWAVDRSPLDEVGVQRLITALDRSGDRAGAVIAYDRLAHRLATDLELRPSPETRALIDAVRTRESSTVPAHLTSGTGRGETTDPGGSRGDEDVRARVSLSLPQRELSRRRRTPLAIGITGVLAASTMVVLATRHPTPLDQHRVAVMMLRTSPASSVSDAFGQRVAQAIRDAIVRTGLLGVVLSSSRADSQVYELDISNGARQAGAGLLVIVSVHGSGDSASADVRLVESSGNRMRWAIPNAVSTAARGPQPVDTVAQRVAGGLAALTDPRFGPWISIAAAMPPTFAAFQEFDRATD